jgi:nucleotide-binding universal stress UspA family protein
MAPRYVLNSTIAKVLELAANDGPSLERDASGIGDTLRAAAIDEAVGECQAACQDVPVRHRFASGFAGPALVVEESNGAALLVISADRQGRLHDALFSSVAHTAFRWGACPIAIVRPSRARPPR